MTQHSEQWTGDSKAKRDRIAMSLKRQNCDAPKAPSGLSHGVDQQEAMTRETLNQLKGHLKQQAAEESAKRAEEAAEKARKAQVQAEANKLPDEARMIALYKGLFT